MSPLVFKTPNDSPETVDLVGVGRLFPFGAGGIPIADAAEGMPELQEKDADGNLKLDDDGNPIPLTGAKLTAAAKEFADARGFTTVNVNERELATLAQDAGQPPDPPDAAEAARDDYARTYGDGLEAVNTDPNELVDPSPGAGVPVVPDTSGAPEATGSAHDEKED